MKAENPQAGKCPKLLLIILIGLLVSLSAETYGQELNGVKIQVNPDALTILKFSDDVRNFEFGKSDVFTAQVQDEVKLRIKTLSNSPTPTNLTVTEGNRTHLFIIDVVKKIDINTFKGYYDYSNLKELKKMIAAGNKVATPSPTASEAPDKTTVITIPASPSTKQTKAEIAQAKKEQKAREKEEAEAARKEKEADDQRKALAAKEQKEQKEKDEAALRQKQQAKDEAQQKLAAAEAEKKRLKDEKATREQAAATAKVREEQLEKENKLAIAEAQKRAQDEEKQRKQEEKEQKARQAKREQEIAAAKEKDRQALTARAAAQQAAEEKKLKDAEAVRLAKKQREDEVARQRQQEIDNQKKAQLAAEKQRVAEDAAARKREKDLEAERKRQEDLARKQQQELEKEQKRQADLAAKREQERIRQEQAEAERIRIREEKKLQAKRDAELAAVRAQERADALIKNPYWKTEWHKKYPQINFGEIPPGQTITGEYYLPKDTLANNAAAIKAIAQPVSMNRKSETLNGVQMVLESITFSGVNSFFRIKVINDGKDDFLVGKMMLSWWKRDGGSFYLTPCYITEFPVVYPGKEATVIYGCRGVNATDKDEFQFSMKERRSDQEMTIPFNGSVYNKQLNK